MRLASAFPDAAGRLRGAAAPAAAAAGQPAASPARRGWGLLLLLLLLPLGWPALLFAQAPQPVPALTAPVTDQAGLLGAAEAAALNERLRALDRETGSQMAVLIVPSTAPEDIFSYSFRVADTWKLGRKGVDDGVLLVVATRDRKYFMQVGYGLEGAIPDARTKQILDDVMRPHFQRGDFAGGINAAVTAVSSLIRGEGLPAPAARQGRGDSGVGGGIFLAIIAGLVASFIGRALFGRFLGGLAGGGVAFALALALGAAIGVALFAAVFAMLAASGRGGFIPGGFGGGHRGGFGGGSFGGGFGGGGGGFGGGGAGGSW